MNDLLAVEKMEKKYSLTIQEYFLNIEHWFTKLYHIGWNLLHSSNDLRSHVNFSSFSYFRICCMYVCMCVYVLLLIYRIHHTYTFRSSPKYIYDFIAVRTGKVSKEIHTVAMYDLLYVCTVEYHCSGYDSHIRFIIAYYNNIR